MSMESFEIPLIMDKIDECDDVTSDPSTQTDPPNGGMKILSRYLRAPSSSCHDICKYGTFVIPAKTKSGPIPKLITPMRGEGHNLEMAVSAERKLKFGSSHHRSFSDSETQNPKSPYAQKRKVSLSTSKETVCPKTTSSGSEGIDVPLELKRNQFRIPSVPRKGSDVQRNCETKKNSKEVNEFRSNERRTSLVGQQRNALVTPSVPLPPKRSLRRIDSMPDSMPALSPKNLKRLSLPSQEKLKTSEPEDLSNKDVSLKSLYKIEPVDENTTLLLPTQHHVRVTDSFSSSSSTLDSKYPKRVKKTTSTTRLPSSKKELRDTRNGAHRRQSSLCSLSLSSSLSSAIQSGSKHKENHTDSDNDTKETYSTSDIDNKENEKKKVCLKTERIRSQRVVGLENKSSPVKNLKLRKEKVVDLQHEDSNPRRLKFTPTVSISPKHSHRKITSLPSLSPLNLKRLSLPSQETTKTIQHEDLGNVENRTLKPTKNRVRVTSSLSSLSLTSERKYVKRVRTRTAAAGSPPSSENNLRTTRSRAMALQSPLQTRNISLSKRSSLSSLSLLSIQFENKSNKETCCAFDNDTEGNCSASDSDTKGILGASKNDTNEKKNRRVGMVSLENKTSPVKKLKFRKGKAVDLQPEDISPRRLKFRQPKLLPEIQADNDGVRKASYKRNEVDGLDLNDAKSLDGNGKRSYRRSRVIEQLFGTRIKSKKVVLRHQNVVRQNNTQSLFNSVIEETASKLAHTRKSKVKALVGAFETVISLQDTRTSAMAGAC